MLCYNCCQSIKVLIGSSLIKLLEIIVVALFCNLVGCFKARHSLEPIRQLGMNFPHNMYFCLMNLSCKALTYRTPWPLTVVQTFYSWCWHCHCCCCCSCCCCCRCCSRCHCCCCRCCRCRCCLCCCCWWWWVSTWQPPSRFFFFLRKAIKKAEKSCKRHSRPNIWFLASNRSIKSQSRANMRQVKGDIGRI